jgi:uncharacterized Zn-binding protein involved in type VI secretion
MPAAARLGDPSTGHGPCSPRPNDQGSPNVFINGLPAHRQGDHWVVHCLHDSVLATGSSTVFVNGKKAGRVGDSVACGDRVASGSPNVFIGDMGSGGSSGPATWKTIKTQWKTEPNTWESV